MQKEKGKQKTALSAILLFIIVLSSLVLNALIGQYIWNNVLVKLFSGVRKVTVSQTFLLMVMVRLFFNLRC